MCPIIRSNGLVNTCGQITAVRCQSAGRELRRASARSPDASTRPVGFGRSLAARGGRRFWDGAMGTAQRPTSPTSLGAPHRPHSRVDNSNSGRPAGRAGRLPARGGALRPPLAPLRAGRRDPRRPARLPVASTSRVPLTRARADAGAERDGRDDRLALLDHPQRALRAAPRQLRRRRGRAHVPVGGGLPHRRAVLHRRLRALLLPDPRRRRARRPGRRGGHARADGRAPPRAAPQALRRAAPPAGGGALPGGPQHLVRERPRLAARDPGRRPRPAPDRHPLLPRPERLRDLRRRQRPPDPRARASSAAWSTSRSPSRSPSSSSTRSPRPPPSWPPPATRAC